MKYNIRVGKRIYSVELDRSRGEVKTGKHLYSYKKSGSFLKLKDKLVLYDCVRDKGGMPKAVFFRGKYIPVEVLKAGEEPRSSLLETEVRAPLNGQVVKISVEKGGHVMTGSVVLTLEAMKMENEMAAPLDGILSQLFVEEKQVVKAGDLLFRIEPLHDKSQGQ